MISAKLFQKKLFDWYHSNPRDLPWIGEANLYRIWVSEIMLQQTRAETVIPFYKKFIEEVPDIDTLAKLSDQKLMQLWQGLGFYRRAQNLKAAAQDIVKQHNSTFPRQYHEIIRLKGIGHYTASAIASFGFSLAFAAVDGNVYRILSRLFMIDRAFTSLTEQQFYRDLAQSLIDPKKPAVFNQAMMNLGATVCTPKSPSCESCPFIANCLSYHRGTVSVYPPQKDKISLKKRFFHFILVQNSKGGLAIEQRKAKDIWNQLFQFPMVETGKKNPKEAELSKLFTKKYPDLSLKSLQLISSSEQKLSHQHIQAFFYLGRPNSSQTKICKAFHYVLPKNLKNFAFPNIIVVFCREYVNSKTE